jgi:hypothetical protein
MSSRLPDSLLLCLGYHALPELITGYPAGARNAKDLSEVADLMQRCVLAGAR